MNNWIKVAASWINLSKCKFFKISKLEADESSLDKEYQIVFFFNSGSISELRHCCTKEETERIEQEFLEKMDNFLD